MRWVGVIIFGAMRAVCKVEEHIFGERYTMFRAGVTMVWVVCHMISGGENMSWGDTMLWEGLSILWVVDDITWGAESMSQEADTILWEAVTMFWVMHDIIWGRGNMSRVGDTMIWGKFACLE